MDALNKKIEKPAETEAQPKRRSKKVLFWMILAIAAIILAVWWRGGSLGSGSYQAVFLDNDQVYFGKVSGLGSSFITLKDVFYLQVNEQIQPVKKGGAQQPQFVLVKLGAKEVHSPTDMMKISKDHIVFIEDLKEDSQLLQAIKQYKATN